MSKYYEDARYINLQELKLKNISSKKIKDLLAKELSHAKLRKKLSGNMLSLSI